MRGTEHGRPTPAVVRGGAAAMSPLMATSSGPLTSHPQAILTLGGGCGGVWVCVCGGGVRVCVGGGGVGMCVGVWGCVCVWVCVCERVI